MRKEFLLVAGILAASVWLAGCVGQPGTQEQAQSYTSMTPEQVIDHLDSKLSELNNQGRFYFKGTVGSAGRKYDYEAWLDEDSEKMKMVLSVPGEGGMTMLFSDNTLYMYDLKGTARTALFGTADCVYYSSKKKAEAQNMSNMENLMSPLKSKGAEFKEFKNCTVNSESRTCAVVHYFNDNGDEVTAWYTMQEGYPVKVIDKRGISTYVTTINQFQNSVPAGAFTVPANCVPIEEIIAQAMNKSYQGQYPANAS